MPEPLFTPADEDALLLRLLQEQGFAANATDAIRPRTTPGDAPLSAQQRRLWFLHQLDPAHDVYVIPGIVRVTGPLEIDRLREALDGLIRRHEALRTTFIERDGAPRQVIGDPAPAHVVIEPIAAPADASDERSLERAVAERLTAALAEPFDLESGPLLRATILRRDALQHYVLLAMHHLISDGWSMSVLIKELGHLYAASGDDAMPEPLPLQYADFAVWQNEWQQGAEAEAQLAYWKDRLRGVPVLDLAPDRARSGTARHRGGAVRRSLDARTMAAIRRTGQAAGATLFMTLLAAWASLLHRYTGQDDIAIGTPTANRTRAELEPLIGLFVNALVVRVDASGRPTFRSLLERVRQASLDAWAQQDLPFEAVVEALQPDRRAGNNPLFQVMFVLQNAPEGRLDVRELELEAVDVPSSTAKFDLTLYAVETDDTVSLLLEYDRDLFEETTAVRMLAHFDILISAAAIEPDRPIADLPLMNGGERVRVLTQWNETGVPYPRDARLHELFWQQAESTPDAIALIAGHQTLTYAQLRRSASRTARRLRRRGVSRNEPVGLIGERSIEAIVGMLAILEAGGGYLPLDPSHPPARLAVLLADAGVRVVLAAARDSRDAVPATIEFLSVDDEDGDQTEDDLTPPDGSALDLAYVMFTSGSTGAPKGVAIPHRAVVRLVRGAGYVAFSGETILQFAPFTFDASTFEIWGALLNGGTLAIAPPGALSLSELGREIVVRKVTTAWLTAGLFHQMVEHERESLRGLCQLVAGGDVLSPASVRALLDTIPELRLVNGFGPTETTTFACCQVITRESLDAASVPIGPPLANTRAYVLDSRGGPTPVGVTGELYIGGDGLGWGYLGRPDLTAEQFLPDPFSPAAGARIYRTGDRARWREDGAIEFLGRRDRQVKVRGFRIEPGEIEAALMRHPLVRQAAVTVHRQGGAEAELVAYVAGPIDSAATMDTVRAFLREQLPGFMLPAHVVLVDALPLTVNGKVDLAALPTPQRSPANDARLRTPTADERAVARIWSGVLHVEPIGITDDFFALGGHSLLATQVVARVRDELGVEVPLRALFTGPTVEALAQEVGRLRDGASPSAAAIPSMPRPAAGHAGNGVLVFPLSFAQRRMWLIDRLDPGNVAYNVPAAVRFQGPFDLDALERAANVVVARHETLRTNIAVFDGEPAQIVTASRPIGVRLVDLSPQHDGLAAVAGLIARDTVVPFDLAADPLLRVSVYRLAAEDHVVQLTIHHIVSDGWSMSVLVNEVSEVYAALRAQASGTHLLGSGIVSEPPDYGLPELSIQYGDYAAWQKEWLTGGLLERLLSYWREQLAAPLTILNLPADRRRPAHQTFRGASIPFAIDTGASSALTALARSEGTTPFMALLAVFDCLLFRYTGQNEVLVGSPIANRGRRELEPLIGFFVNTLVLRTQVDGAMTFRELLSSVRETTLEAYAHQDLPFEHLVEVLQPARNLSHTPFFQVLFALQNTPALPAGAADAAVSPLAIESVAAKFDLSVSLTEVPAGLVGAAEYNLDLFDRGTIERLLAHYVDLIAAAAASPDTAIGRLPLLSHDDRVSLAAWNDTAVPLEEPATLVSEIETQARQNGDRMALLFELEGLTYRELNRRANQLARRLQREGVTTETIVGVCLERSVDLIVTLVAVLKAGGAYLPLDPTYPRDRLQYMMSVAGARHLVTWRPLVEARDLRAGHMAYLDEVRPMLDMEAGGDLGLPLSGDNAAYVIFTSGSTGRPKGAINTHRAIVNRLRWMKRECGMTAEERILHKAPYSFDVSVCEIFMPLVIGGCLIVARPEGHKDPGYLTDIIDAMQISTAHFVPSMLRAFLDAPRTSSCPSLVRVYTSGETHPPDVMTAFMDRFSAELLNTYGPTETAVEMSCWRCRRGDPSASLPIGVPIDNTTVHIVDESYGLVPAGVAGEICIGGVPVARGYIGRPDLTAERFVPDPFGPPGARLYRSGDRGRWRADGQMEFLGRLDLQLKIRGFRVEAGEIEAQLLQDPEVAAAAVVAREARPGDVRLVAYVVPAGATIDRSALKERLRSQLPEYMIPAAVVSLPALPLLTSGKIDRSSLPEPDWTDGVVRTDTAPRTPSEEIVLGIWRDLLGAGTLGVDDNFFSLGGHSLLATQVISRIAEIFGVELPLRSIFEWATVRTLSQHLDATRREPAGGVLPPILPVPRTGRLRPSYAQQRLWVLSHLEPGSAAYNMPAALRLDGRLDIGALERTLEELMRRHEVLRSRFAVEDGVPVTIIDPEPGWTLAIDDLAPLAADEQTREVAAKAGAEFERPFDLERGPLVRARLLRLGPDAQVLLLTAHHIVSDGWSTVLLIDDLVRIYAASLQSLPSPLPPLAIQYADFAEWQRGWLDGPILAAQLEYWKRQLAGAPAMVQLPTDRLRPPVQRFEGATTTFSLGSTLASGISRLSARAGATTFMWMLAAFFVLLARYTRLHDLVVGTPMAGRTRTELEPIVGFFLNTLIIRVDLSGDPTFHKLLGRVRQVVLDASAHQDVPFDQIVEALRPERSTSYTPLFQIVFSGVMTEASPMTLPDVTVTPLPPARVAAKFDLTVGFGEGSHDITGSFEYNTALFDETTIARMARHYCTLLASAVASPDGKVSALDMIPAEERAALTSDRAPARSVDRTDTVPERVARTAAERGEAVAVRDSTRSLSYSELEGRANALAHRLVGLGIRAELRVAICLDRSVELVVALLAVLKAGGAYVPLDPSYPAERLQFMLADSGASLLIASPAAAPVIGRHRAEITTVVPDRSWNETAATPPVTADASTLAYVIYTSGSTGAPKGVEVAHSALVNLVDWHIGTFVVTAADRGSQVASLAFDAAVWEIWPTLVAGAELHLADDATVHSPRALVRWLIERRITVAFVPTPLAERMIGADWTGASLRWLLTGGDRLHDWTPSSAPFVLVNNYGPTENAVVATSGLVPPKSDDTVALPSIGRAITGTDLYVVDERLELVPVGVPGELVIGGRSLARGYHGRPALTAERFVPDPFSSEPSARLYRTGDLVRRRPDGSLDFLRRIDRQVKVRGYRIELGEVEAALGRHPGVERAAVLLQGETTDPTLTAYVVTRRETKSESLREHLGAHLPAYMVPAAIVILERMPLTASGKVDTAALLAITPARAGAALAVRPRNEMERLVAGIWSVVLALETVAVHDNFFDVGGHSLKLIDVHGRLEAALGRTVPVVELFRYPTIATLSAFLAAAPQVGRGDATVSEAKQRGQRQRAARARRPAASGAER